MLPRFHLPNLFNSVNEDTEDEFDDFLEILSRPRRTPVIRDRSDYTMLDDIDFKMRFRLTKESVQYIHGMIEENIRPWSSRNQAINTMDRLLLTLRYFATGSYLMAAGDFVGVSQASSSRIIDEVSSAIAALRPTFIKIPEDLNEVKRDFFAIAKFPKVIGALDCTHVQIKNPGGSYAENFRNRKSTFSINVQVVASAKLEILDIVARWPGSSHDQTIYDNSVLKVQINSGRFGDSIILADSGYENNNYILTPLENPLTSAENLYNESQIRTRNVVERTFGVWKNRFPVLRRVVTLDLSKVQKIIVACAILHNVAINFNDELPMDEHEDDMQIEEDRYDGEGNEDVRSEMILYFQTLLNRLDT